MLLLRAQYAWKRPPMSMNESPESSNHADLVQIGRGLSSPGGATESGQPAAKVFIKTYGCQMNEYDTQKLYKLLEHRYSPTDSLQDADLILLNTCSVREKPERKLYGVLQRLEGLKRERPDVLVGVGGCVAQSEGQKLVDRSRSVDFVFGTHNLSLVPSLIDQRRAGAPPQVAVNYRDEWEDLPLGVPENGRVSAFISISRGCNKNCTYCIVPITRGKEVSRDPKEVEREVRIAAHRGVREVVLLGQTVNSYGLDLAPRLRFAELLSRIAEISGIERIRFTSPHPQEVREDFIELVASNPKVCRHIHMPLQSGSDRILKLMNRNYRKDRYLRIIDALRERVPDIAITTDVIVGFPGETRGDFEETMAVLEYVQFDSSYSFVFSPRPGTIAADLKEDLTADEKLERLQEFQARQDEITTERLGSWVGKATEILIDGPSKSQPDHLQGRNSQNLLINLSDRYDHLRPGMIVPVLVTAQSKYTLRGELPTAAASAGTAA